VTARLDAIRAQAAALRAWAGALDAQIAEAEQREAEQHAWEPAGKVARLTLPPKLRTRLALGQTRLERCSKCGCLRTSGAPWLFRDRLRVWSHRKPTCTTR
jgi:hypothetical protein